MLEFWLSWSCVALVQTTTTVVSWCIQSPRCVNKSHDFTNLLLIYQLLCFFSTPSFMTAFEPQMGESWLRWFIYSSVSTIAHDQHVDPLKTRITWIKWRVTQISVYKYLEGSLKAWPFSKIATANSPNSLFCSIRKQLVSSITIMPLFHHWAHAARQVSNEHAESSIRWDHWFLFSPSSLHSTAYHYLS